MRKASYAAGTSALCDASIERKRGQLVMPRQSGLAEQFRRAVVSDWLRHRVQIGSVSGGHSKKKMRSVRHVAACRGSDRGTRRNACPLRHVGQRTPAPLKPCSRMRGARDRAAARRTDPARGEKGRLSIEPVF